MKKPERTKTFLENLIAGLLGPSDPSLAESLKTPNEDAMDEIPATFLKAPYVGRCKICNTRGLPSPEHEVLCDYWACEGHCKEYHSGMDSHRKWDGSRTPRRAPPLAHNERCVCVLCRARGPTRSVIPPETPAIPEFGKVEEVNVEFPVEDDWGLRKGSGRISLPKELGGLDT